MGAALIVTDWVSGKQCPLDTISLKVTGLLFNVAIGSAILVSLRCKAGLHEYCMPKEEANFILDFNSILPFSQIVVSPVSDIFTLLPTVTGTEALAIQPILLKAFTVYVMDTGAEQRGFAELESLR